MMEEPIVLISVMYPGGADTRFDHDYYLATHIPLLKERWTSLGLEKLQIARAVATPDGSPPRYLLIALLTFRSAADFQAAAAAHGPEIFADIPNFSNVQPMIQINDVVA
jgi:uncharacterized protein (TIGR02118 family)